MDITAFYELKNRLYASAAAGCGSISEDFRLKRAIESFEPLSKANKAFEKLYGLCESLIKSENPETELPDCIALADALAVTQGTYKDGSETKETPKNDMITIEIPRSELEQFYDNIPKNAAELWKLPKEKARHVKDPRILRAILHDLENGKETPEIKLSMDMLCRIYGDPLTDILKAEVKNSGKQIKYVETLRGDMENEWYLSLYENTDNPENVRAEAVSAMACSESNTDKLIEIYKTEKGKIKKAAITALAKLDPKEAEPIFAKMSLKFKDSYKDFFAASNCEICTKYVANKIDKEAVKHHEENAKKTLYRVMYTTNDLFMLGSKTGEDVYKAYMTLKDDPYYTDYAVNFTLIKALKNFENREKTAELINRLYKQDKDYFLLAKTFLDITQNPETPLPTKQKTRTKISQVVNHIYYIPLLEQYYIEPSFAGYGYGLESPVFPLGERFPKAVLKFLVKISKDAIEEAKEVQNSKNEGMLKIGSPCPNRPVNEKFMAASKCLQDASSYLGNLAKLCNPLDYEEIKNAVSANFTKESAGFFYNPFSSYFIITDFCGGFSADEKIDLITECMLNTLKYEASTINVTTYVCNIGLDTSDQLRALEHLKKALEELRQKAEKNKWIISEKLFTVQKNMIESAYQYVSTHS